MKGKYVTIKADVSSIQKWVDTARVSGATMINEKLDNISKTVDELLNMYEDLQIKGTSPPEQTTTKSTSTDGELLNLELDVQFIIAESNGKWKFYTSLDGGEAVLRKTWDVQPTAEMLYKEVVNIFSSFDYMNQIVLLKYHVQLWRNCQ